MATIGEALAAAQSQIDRQDAQYLLAGLTGSSRAFLLAHGERDLSGQQAAQFAKHVAARATGVPVAQILGRREFYGRDFVVNAHVLIPRPETEILVEQALALVSGNKCLKTHASPCVLDLGCGSGAIAVTLALELPDAKVTALDQSLDALRIAQQNARTLGASVSFIKSDWYRALTGRKFDLIVANPPYIAAHDPHLSQGDLRFEPPQALTDNSADGLDAIRTIVTGARAHLHDGGWLMFEHGFDQAERCRALLAQHGFAAIASVPDLAGIPRVTMGQHLPTPAV